MGFFSWDCKGCGHSIRHRGACRKESNWLSQAVVLTEDGSRVIGEYSGYGEVGGFHDEGSNELDGSSIWHSACWKLAGKPEFDGPSRHANDQGHFVGEYDPTEPTTVAEMVVLKVVADEKVKEEQKKWEEYSKKRQAERAAAGKAS